MPPPWRRAGGSASCRGRTSRAVPDSPSSHGASEGRQGARAREESAMAGLLLEGVPIQEYLAAEESHPWPAPRRPSLVGREARDAQMLLLLDGPGWRGIPDGEIGVRDHAHRAIARIEAEDARGILRHHRRHPR